MQFPPPSFIETLASLRGLSSSVMMVADRVRFLDSLLPAARSCSQVCYSKQTRRARLDMRASKNSIWRMVAAISAEIERNGRGREMVMRSSL